MSNIVIKQGRKSRREVTVGDSDRSLQTAHAYDDNAELCCWRSCDSCHFACCLPPEPEFTLQPVAIKPSLEVCEVTETSANQVICVPSRHPFNTPNQFGDYYASPSSMYYGPSRPAPNWAMGYCENRLHMGYNPATPAAIPPRVRLNCSTGNFGSSLDAGVKTVTQQTSNSLLPTMVRSCDSNNWLPKSTLPQFVVEPLRGY